MYVWSVGSYYGPMFWGFFFGTSLVGTTIVQAYIYYTRSSDRWTLQSVVAILLILDITTTALMAVTIFHYFLINFGDDSAFLGIPDPWIIENGVTALITFIAQVFFASRIFMVTRQYAIFSPYDKIIPGVIIFFALGGLAACGVRTNYIATLSVYGLSGRNMQIVFSIEEACGVISDLLSTMSLCYILASARGRIPRKSRLRSLFFFILNRGILVTIVQTGMLIAYLSAPLFLYWTPFQMLKSKLYTNTLLAMLNSRGEGQSWSTAHTLHLRQSVAPTPIFTLPVSNNQSRNPDAEKALEKDERDKDNIINSDARRSRRSPSIGGAYLSGTNGHPSNTSSSIVE
ncbi:hypothetical protein BJ138DRAFT_1110906 [Hygrophoropsis aurantiaca]|uniref:Uncharacterized protein n=1 Tax=Hygrophoropsis aurantiaca TaxID=72124 RepID=A0ACB8AL44_9AGAM|nr:hypothetical protein BJ138DRAFT_1110906 [Hygrophoropsis aurantiaca]